MAEDLASAVRLRRRPGARQMRMPKPWPLLLAAATSLLLGLAPITATAHATLLSASPEPNESLASAPGVVELRFSEPVNPRLSRAAIRAPDGRVYQTASVESDRAQVQLNTNLPGVYRVDWVTVSSLDGHTLKGSYVFGVRVKPGQAGLQPSFSLAPTDVALGAFRALEYLALFSAVGTLLLRWLARRAGLAEPVGDLRLPTVAALLAGIAVVIGEAAAAAGSFSAQALVDYTTNGPPGWARVGRLLAELVAVVAAFTGSGRAGLALVAAMAALAATGHAAASRPPGLAILVDAVHLLSGAVWAGGIIALARYRLSRRWSRESGLELMRRFAPYAIAGFVASVGLGLVRATEELSSPSDLVETTYGELLSVKGLAVAGMALLALLITRRRPGLVRLDALLALVVIGATALLAAHPLPPRRSAEAEAFGESRQASTALPREGDLTLGGEAGEVLLGLTLRPGLPGPNDVLPYVAPLQPQSLAALPVELRLDDHGVALNACGVTCRRGRADVRGGERAVVHVASTGGGVAVFDIPRLPAASGQDQMTAVNDRMHSLRSYAVHETLGPAKVPLSSEYRFVAPDRMQLKVNNGFERILIGSTTFTRTAADQSWKSEPGEPIDTRRQLWDYAPSIQPRLLESRPLGGKTYQVLSFFEGSSSSPIWFRLYVDEGGYVTRAEMRAKGHFMDQDYSDFDRPLFVSPPS